MVYIGQLIYSDQSYLMHHGILGQKWGVRRYQNKDGSLTEAGKRRLALLEKKEAKYVQKRKLLTGDKDEKNKKNQNDQSKKDSEEPEYLHGTKPIGKMSTDELRREIERLDLEKRYKMYMNELYPKKPDENQSRLSSVGKKAFNDYVAPALKNVGKQAAENVIGMGANRLGQMLGLENELYTVRSAKNKNYQKEQWEKDRDRITSENTRLKNEAERNKINEEKRKIEEILKKNPKLRQQMKQSSTNKKK